MVVLVIMVVIGIVLVIVIVFVIVIVLVIVIETVVVIVVVIVFVLRHIPPFLQRTFLYVLGAIEVPPQSAIRHLWSFLSLLVMFVIA